MDNHEVRILDYVGAINCEFKTHTIDGVRWVAAHIEHGRNGLSEVKVYYTRIYCSEIQPTKRVFTVLDNLSGKDNNFTNKILFLYDKKVFEYVSDPLLIRYSIPVWDVDFTKVYLETVKPPCRWGNPDKLFTPAKSDQIACLEQLLWRGRIEASDIMADAMLRTFHPKELINITQRYYD